MTADRLRLDAEASMSDTFSRNADTYFEPPRNPSLVSHKAMDLDSGQDLEKALGELWADDPERLSMIPDMVAIALSVKDNSREQSSDLDSFIYVMY